MSSGKIDPIYEAVGKEIIQNFYGKGSGKSKYYNERGDLLLGKIEKDIVELIRRVDTKEPPKPSHNNGITGKPQICPHYVFARENPDNWNPQPESGRHLCKVKGELRNE